jgi:hypothetical protein
VLRLHFDDGAQRQINLEAELLCPVFAALRDEPELFVSLVESTIPRQVKPHQVRQFLSLVERATLKLVEDWRYRPPS